MAYVNPFISGQLFDPEANRKVGRLVPDGFQTGTAGQAQSFAASEQARQQAEIAASQQAQQQAQQLQQQLEAEAARQQQQQQQERDDAYRLEQDRLTQSRFTQQQDIQQKQFDAQLKLLRDQEAARQAGQVSQDAQRIMSQGGYGAGQFGGGAFGGWSQWIVPYTTRWGTPGYQINTDQNANGGQAYSGASGHWISTPNGSW